jgi:RNA polymerase sigma-70 factor (ECF subfamily)
MAHRALGDAGLAEEAVQETFLRAWRAADRYDPGLSSLRTWLFAIARNVVVDLAAGAVLAPAARGAGAGA